MANIENRKCEVHGLVPHRLDGKTRWRCRACEASRIAKRRRRIKALLVKEAGGKCVRCGYNRCEVALEFHHRDASSKFFNVSAKGNTYSLARLRKEAKKCDLLCANCHREVELIAAGAIGSATRC